MKAILDVYYEKESSHASCIVFKDWQDITPYDFARLTLPAALDYHPGRFYERELPYLIAVLNEFIYRFNTIIIDGYVHLKRDVGKGLGTYLFESLPYPVSIIGVAKNPLKIADSFIAITRGASKRPLFISAIGCPVEDAANYILSMHGRYRIPTLLKVADKLARGLYR
ncbi:MAG TPA: endonuclease V [Syntrophorhabdaceae bacterium]|nr:endonuclease V [Syntrophorhabdaceae bacterium]